MSKAKKKQKAKPAPAKKKPAPKRPAKAAKSVKKQAKTPAKKAVPPPPSSVAIVDSPAPRPPPVPRRKDGPAVPLKPPVVRVKHAIFGIGKLVRELPEGKIEVHFDKVGRKTLLASFVELLPPVLGG